MTNSDRLQEIRERVQLTRETYPNNGTILLLGSDLDGLLQLVTEQQSWEKRAIEKLRARVADITSRPESQPHTIWNAQNFLEQVEAAMEAKE